MSGNETTICPWCQTEIVWDEELGPEPYCPHCDNELSGYRTVQIGIEREDEEDDQDDSDWEGGPEEPVDFAELDEVDTNSVWYKVDQALKVIVDSQEEAPECPECKEYMAELGVQAMPAGFVPTKHSSIGNSLVKAAFETVWYVCPACYRTTSVLSQADRDEMVRRLSSAAE
ncbi:hypothetical protein [Paenibacillus protaetiae]|uniref:Uncharacterized protein n=1 Tax=Paenibacillus protaetiae TaxID=2509456 RepID=A0A4P6EVQ4_9BACL|nr:hypothetical protein [Paenibacillus protaetiae]QAY66635.1 hypothetical protein ET464_09690 [Paenibacillus protaetiae]